MDYKTIKLTESDNVATVILNRPAERNAINEAMLEELIVCINYCNENANIRAVILTGSGKAFCSGGDLKELEPFNDSAYLRTKRFLNVGLPAFLEVRRAAKPVIAAVNGPAIGAGFALALSCDIILAAKSARFNAHYVLIGLSPDAGMSHILPRLVGDKRATWLMFTGEMVDARKGFEMGFVNMVVEDNELLNESEALAKKLAASATLAIARIKELINRSQHESLETQMEYEKQLLARLVLTEDHREAVAAFQEKRKPIFKGR